MTLQLLNNNDGRSSVSSVAHDGSVVSVNSTTNSKNPGNSGQFGGVGSSFEFAQCVEQINVLNLRLKNADDRAKNLMADLQHAKQVCAEQHHHLHTNKLPPLPPPLLLSSSQILLNSFDSPFSGESASLPPLTMYQQHQNNSSNTITPKANLARTITQHLNIANGISFARSSFNGDSFTKSSISSSSGAATPASSMHGGASSPTLPTSPSVSVCCGALVSYVLGGRSWHFYSCTLFLWFLETTFCTCICKKLVSCTSVCDHMFICCCH